jgi:hypothetical protein
MMADRRHFSLPASLCNKASAPHHERNNGLAVFGTHCMCMISRCVFASESDGHIYYYNFAVVVELVVWSS